MKTFKIVLLLITISSVAYAKQDIESAKTYSQTEIDLKFQIQEQAIKNIAKALENQQYNLKESLSKQDSLLDKTCNDYSNHISFWSGWMTWISIIFAVALALISIFVSIKLGKISKEVDDELKNINDIKIKAEKAEEDTEKTKSEIEALKEEIVKLKGNAETCLSQIKVKTIEATELISQAKAHLPQEQTKENKERISEYVEEANKTKTESQLTAEDWFLKGYNAQIESKYTDAFFYYKKAIELAPDYADAYNNWGMTLSDLAERKSDEAGFRKGISKYKKAIEFNPNKSTFYFNLGLAFYCLAKLKNDESLYLASTVQFIKAIDLDPKDSNIVNHLGTSYSEIARLNYKKSIAYKNNSEYEESEKTRNLSEELYEKSIAMLKHSIKLSPTNAYAYNNLGKAISYFADSSEKVEKYDESITQFERAIALNPNYADAYNNWGVVILRLAQLKSSKILCKKSISKFNKAIELKLDYVDAYNNWITSLSYLEKLQNDQELYKDEVKELKNKRDLISKKQEYRSACLYASSVNDKEQALEYLEKAIKIKNYNLTRTYIETEPEFDNINTEPEFKTLLDKYYTAQK